MNVSGLRQMAKTKPRTWPLLSQQSRRVSENGRGALQVGELANVLKLLRPPNVLHQGLAFEKTVCRLLEKSSLKHRKYQEEEGAERLQGASKPYQVCFGESENCDDATWMALGHASLASGLSHPMQWPPANRIGERSITMIDEASNKDRQRRSILPRERGTPV